MMPVGSGSSDARHAGKRQQLGKGNAPEMDSEDPSPTQTPRSEREHEFEENEAGRKIDSPQSSTHSNADNNGSVHADQSRPRFAYADYSLAPTTQTTVVTTTTTTTTNFPPLVLQDPVLRHDIDARDYPLVNADTPAALRKFAFDIDGTPTWFRESANPLESMKKLQTTIDNLQRGNGFFQDRSEEYRSSGSNPAILESRKRLASPDSRHRDTSSNESARKRRHVHESGERRSSFSHANSSSSDPLMPRAPRPVRSNRPSNHFLNTFSGGSCRSPDDPSYRSGGIHDDQIDPLNVHPESESRVSEQVPGSPESQDGPAQSLPFPSPTQSPTTDAIHNQDRSDGYDTHNANKIGTPREPVTKMSTSAKHSTQARAFMDLPRILSTFDGLDHHVQSYLMFHLLKRCRKSTLQQVVGFIEPTLRKDFLALLPFELSLKILNELDAKSLCRVSQVSKAWNALVNADEWIWKNRFENDGYFLSKNELHKAIEEGWGSYEANTTGASYVPCSRNHDSITASAESIDMLREPNFMPAQTVQGNRRPGKVIRRIARRKPTSEEFEGIARRHFQELVDEGALQPLQGHHLYKALYRRHHINRENWMRPSAKPHHISFTGHPNNVVTCLQFDAEKIITGSDDNFINIYETQTGRLRRRLVGHEGGVWALQYEGNTLVSGSTDRTVRVWNIETGRNTHVFHGHTSTVRCLQILTPQPLDFDKPDSKKGPEMPVIVTGSRDSTLRVWRVPQDGETEFAPHQDATSPELQEIQSVISAQRNPFYLRTLSGHAASVRAISGYADTLVSGSYDNTVRVWNVSTGDCIWRLAGHTQKVYSIVLDYPNKRCMSGSLDACVRIWSLESGVCLHVLHGHSMLVGLLHLSFNTLVSAAADTTLRVWDADSGECKHKLAAHTGAITCFQHDENKVISGSDGTLKMWDVRTGKHVRDLLTGLSSVWQVGFDERRCVAAVQRDNVTTIEVLDFGAEADGVPETERSGRIVVRNNIMPEHEHPIDMMG